MRAPPQRRSAPGGAPARSQGGAAGQNPAQNSPKGKAAAARPSRSGHAPGKPGGAGLVELHPALALAAALLVVLAALGLTLATGGRGRALHARASAYADRTLASLGLRVARVQLQGASGFARPYILQAAGVEPGRSILGLDLADLRARVERVGYVKSARVLRLLPDTLRLSVTERPRLAVWQHAGRVGVVDDQGRPIDGADPGLFPDLPLIVGEGAPEAAAAVLPAVQARPRLMQRLEALVRVDARRWDLRLKDGGLIQLPAEGEDAALIQLDQLDQRSRLLELGFERIDLRDPEMVTVRPRAAAARPSVDSAPVL